MIEEPADVFARSLAPRWKGLMERSPDVRILFSNLKPSLGYGGVERWMIDAATGLSDAGHDERHAAVGRVRRGCAAARRGTGLRVREDITARGLQRACACRGHAGGTPRLVVAKGKKTARWLRGAVRRRRRARGHLLRR